MTRGAEGQVGSDRNNGDGRKPGNVASAASAASGGRAEANRRNARHSTGPKSPEGKAKSSRNALKHGLTAGQAVLDDEDSAEYQTRLGEWLAFYRPADPAYRAVIERAVYHTWRLGRCARYEAATTGERVRHAAARHDFAQRSHAEGVGKRLIHEPIDRCRMPEIYDPVVRDRIQKRVDDGPALLHLELIQSAAGVDWLLARWAELAEMLRFHGFWHYPEKLQALRLLGKRPEDVIEDPEVGRILLACHAAHPEPWDFLNEVIQTKLGLDHRPMYYVQVEDIKGLLPATPEEGVEFLRSVIRAETTRLRRLKSNGLDDLDRADRDGAAGRALFDASPAGTLFHRYEAACDRALHTSIRDLTALRDRQTAGAEATAPTGPVKPRVPDPVGHPSAAPSGPPLRNEPIAEVSIREWVAYGRCESAAVGTSDPAVPPGDAQAGRLGTPSQPVRRCKTDPS